MKNLLTLILLCFTMGLSAQNLSLNELIALRKMGLDEVESFLTKKGWHYKTGESALDEKMGMAQFVYGTDGDFDYAESFLNFYYPPVYGENRIGIQIGKRQKATEYLEAIKRFAPSPITTKVENGNLIKIYAGATTTFEFTTTKTTDIFGDDLAFWNLFIVENEDYETQFGYF